MLLALLAFPCPFGPATLVNQAGSCLSNEGSEREDGDDSPIKMARLIELNTSFCQTISAKIKLPGLLAQGRILRHTKTTHEPC